MLACHFLRLGYVKIAAWYPIPKSEWQVVSPNRDNGILAHLCTQQSASHHCQGLYVTWNDERGERRQSHASTTASVSVLSQEIGQEELLRNDLFCVGWPGWDVKP